MMQKNWIKLSFVYVIKYYIQINDSWIISCLRVQAGTIRDWADKVGPECFG